MKKGVLASVLLALVLLACAAGAQTLPGIGCFSPGLVRLSALEAQRAPMIAEAEVRIDNAAYARDLSVLHAMLDGTTLRCELAPGIDRLSVIPQGETLGVYDLPAQEEADALLSALSGTAVLERVPLVSVAEWLEGLAAGDAFLFGFAVSEPFVLERTMSDDGTRLTKITFMAGSIARSGEAPYTVTGFLRQPAGRAPKDTFELALRQDDANFMELSYSALRENEITLKDKAGTTSVRTALKAAGKIAGSGISSRLSVTTKNEWTADGENLNEKITVSASLEHQDKTPGRRMLRLNDVSASNKHILTLTTNETKNESIALNDRITLEMTMDGNVFVQGAADVRMHVGAGIDAPAATPGEAQCAPLDAREALQALSAAIYQQLDEQTRAQIGKGL